MWSHGKFHWNELMTRDVEKAKKFYGETLGWTFEAMPMPDGGTYWVAKMGDTPVGGMCPQGPEHGGAPDSWGAYIAVDDVDARLEEGKAGGGKVLLEPFDVPGVGRIAIIQDPNGAAIGWMTPVSS